MEINEYLDMVLDGVNNYFDPAVNYKGEYQFNYKVLKEASKVTEDGTNLIEEYFKKYFFDKAHDIFPNFRDIPLIFNNTYKKDGYGRCLRISNNDIVASLFFSITGVYPKISDDKTDEENRKAIRDRIREYLRNSRDCINKGKNSEHYNFFYNNYLSFNKQGYNFTFDQYMNKMTNLICDGFFANLIRFYNTFNKDIDINKIHEMVDIEKFDFIMAHQLIILSQVASEVVDTYHNSLASVYKYIEAIDLYIKEVDPNYRISLTSYDVVGNPIPNYNYHKLKKEFNEIVTKYPQFQVISVDSNSINFDPKDVDEIEKYKSMIAKVFEDNVLSASWELIPDGNGNRVNSYSSNVQHRGSSIDNIEARLTKGQQRLVNCKMFLDSTDYLKTIRGINNFDGYIGYIYSSGIVVFEKFYKKYETRIPVDEGATYVMTFDNFVDMSQKTKAEIMDYIKNNGEDVRRIYHSGEWQDKVSTVIRTGDLSVLDKWKENKVLKKSIFSEKNSNEN